MARTILITSCIAGLVSLSSGQGLDSSTLSTLQASATVENGIAWVLAIEGVTGAWTYSAPFNDRAGFVDIAQYATSIKFVSASGSYSIYATECSNPVWAINNGYEASFTVDESTGLITGYANTANWIGDTQYMSNSCYAGLAVGQAPRSLNDIIYHACGNSGGGVHVEGDNGNAKFHSLEDGANVFLGFDDAWSTDCYGNDISARDCSILAIDNFLLHCSDEFAAQNAELDGLDSQITAVETRLTTAEESIQTNADAITNLQSADSALDARITTNEGDITALQSEESTMSSEISQLQTDVVALNARVDLFANFAAQSAPVGLVDGGEAASDSISALSWKDMAMFSLLIVNLVMMCFNCFRGFCQTKRRKYVGVAMDDESDFGEVRAFKK
eukprot:CAMPEP_0197023880 /NCGR_PEP_ID=MMETSP1384-20130603/4520_1 /TAXON_ID=29189 /ORGANISM="Ammonia sp." /LENGTH=388 /DNA_ID=CAMNT_0042452171 /DNA_START=17 /DNA_END=1183 /DNA_ORIENTATION=+